MKSRWMLKCNSIDIDELYEITNIDKIVLTILINRGIKTPYDIDRFINASLKELYDPFLMKDMDKGVDIIKRGIEKGKKIAVYGDYDADGVTSTVILYSALKRCGADITYHIPHRESEGYGMNTERIKKLKEDGVEIIISCDNGISAIEQVKLAVELGMEVVITDHHELSFVEDNEGKREYILPEAHAVINPKREDCTYPFKLLCGAGIAFKFAQALYSTMNIDDKEVYPFLQFAAIGTICDVVDLIDENRIIVKNGLPIIKNTNNLGLKSLIKVTGLEGKDLTSYHIGFIIGPCINATGRLETAELSVELLLTEDEYKAEDLGKKLHQLNTERQDITAESVKSIEGIIESGDYKNKKVLVLYEENVHESIAGIVAGRIKEKHNMPTIILTKGKDGVKGSGRSIEGYNMFEELLKCKELLDRFGGHPMAAGLTLQKEKIEELNTILNENCNLAPEDFIPKISIDKRLLLKNISIPMVEKLQILEPFGKGNSSPIFAEKSVLIDKILILGKDRNTIKFCLRIDGSFNKIDGLCFGRGQEFEEELKRRYGNSHLGIMNNPSGLKMDFIFYPYINEYNGYITPQLRIIDYRFSN
ncbi:single-stranded-DNA-specific exonuclease RecJ [uncultured Clostridium sp.]|uniref:single-stranded-DNA-specific exonuclease RecJ n=1 Tax=uncultured Clostridium sp. TaxID=59620 RepID=UPI0028E18C4B|nr:single-stranded-DNA-specific exonuclease RecJ [uncultured Clostridium sp.]